MTRIEDKTNTVKAV